MKKAFTLIALAAAVYAAPMAAQTSVWTLDSRAAVMRGDARGVSIEADGTLRPAPALTEVFATGQPYVWSTAVTGAGDILLGTGGEGKLFKYSRPARDGALLADLPELNVSAVVAAPNGEIFAATLPDGKVYRIDAAGKFEVYFDPKEKYIWAMALLTDGSLAVATGENGKIFRVRRAGQTPESSIFADTSETHIVSLEIDKQGNLLAGSDAGGSVLRFDGAGKAFALLDSPLREIKQLSVGPDGSIYALAISAAAAAATPAPAQPDAKADERPALTITAELPAKSRHNLTGAKSAVYRIFPDGTSDILWSSASVTAFSVYAQLGGGVLIGTSDRGRIYEIDDDGRETMLQQSPAGQISKIFSAGKTVFAASSADANLYLAGEASSADASYTSPVFDAKTSASWGRIWWGGGGSVEVQTRSGNTDTADETWSLWTPVKNSRGGPTGGQIASPTGRYLQWRAVFRPATPQSYLSDVRVAYKARNVAPEILSIQVLPANVGLTANPPQPIDPNIELSGLDPAVFGVPATAPAPRRIFQRSARSFQWTAEDGNSDKLVYDVYYKTSADRDFRPLKLDLIENFLTVDGQTLPDGRYVVKVVARDSPSNPAPLALAGERFTEPFDIDNSAPVFVAASASGGSAVFSVQDRASYISGAEYSIDGGSWQAVYADDGIADSPEEKFTVVPPQAAGEYAVTLRVFDANGNSANARVTVTRQ